ncbi:uncharacterized protein LOC119089307 [Pollicipes pollicipes]|uniref:uncharacterized protein LOC119089307 n=1 Tax=Pollicipes pollicipes TaxID=41117 RepID=UPI001884BC51|nr:uncharacterized protein LOC119089307 [Pollicipes pollicipes]
MREPDLTHDVSLLPHCVAILRHLALFSAGCRHHLGDDGQLQLLLVRVLLMFRLDAQVRAAAVQLLLAISLDGQLICRRARGQLWQLTVPELLATALRLPFVTTVRERRRLVTADTAVPLAPERRQLRVSCAGLLRTAWGLAWHGALAAQPAHAEYRALALLVEHSRLFTETLARAAGEHQLGHHETALRE